MEFLLSKGEGILKCKDTQFKKKLIKKIEVLLWHHWVSWENQTNKQKINK